MDGMQSGFLREHAAVSAPRITPARRMVEGRVVPTLLRLAAPNLADAAARVTFIAMDAVFVGWLGTEALAGVSLVFPLVLLMHMASGSGIGSGVAASVARALGAGDRARAERLAAHAVWIALAAGLLTGVPLALDGPALYAAFGARGGAVAEAVAYSSVLAPGLVLVWLANLLINVLRGSGDMVSAASAVVAGELVHLGLTPLLMLGWGPIPALGVRGAALAVLASYGIGVIVCLVRLRMAGSGLRLRASGFAPHRTGFAPTLRIGLPATLNVLLWQAGSVAMGGFAARFGTAALAGYGAAQRLELLQLPVTFALGSAVISMVAANLGAGDRARARIAARAGAVVAGGIGMLTGLVALLVPAGWTAIFTADPAAIAAGALYLRGIGWTMPFAGIGIAAFFALLGAGRSFPPMLGTLFRLVFVLIGGTLAVALGTGFGAIILAMAAGTLVFAGLTASLAPHALR